METFFRPEDYQVYLALMATLILSGIPIQDKFDVQLAFHRQGCMLRDSRIGAEYMTFIMEQAV